MTDDEVSAAITRYEEELKIPATDALTRSPQNLIALLLSAFPQIGGTVAK